MSSTVSDSETDGEHSPRRRKNGLHRGPLEVFIIRISPACRSVLLYLQQNEIPHVSVDVDFSHGTEHLPTVFRSQPHQEVPLLVDGEIVVFEGPAILRYLAMRYTDYAGFGLNLQQQMSNESIINWAFGELHRAVGYNYIYPQFLEKYALSPEDANESMVEQGLRQVSKHLEIIEKKYFKSSKDKFLTGNRLTVADTAVATVLVLLEWTGFKFKMWPQVEAWLNRVKRQHFWDNVHTTHLDFVMQLQRASMILD